MVLEWRKVCYPSVRVDNTLDISLLITSTVQLKTGLNLTSIPKTTKLLWENWLVKYENPKIVVGFGGVRFLDELSGGFIVCSHVTKCIVNFNNPDRLGLVRNFETLVISNSKCKQGINSIRNKYDP